MAEGEDILKELLNDIAVLPNTEIETEETNVRREIENESLRVQIERQREELEGLRQDRIQRGDFSYNIFILLLLYLTAVISIVIVVASGLAYLSDTVLSILLGTTTTNIIGIFTFVAKYLFHTKE